MTAPKKIGFIVNPIAGLGGTVGLKGSDDADIVEQAAALGGIPESSMRAGLALDVIKEAAAPFEFYAYEGDMGEDELRNHGFEAIIVGKPAAEKTTAQDTIDAARRMKDLGVDILLFAGGDGTARNICEAVGDAVPVVGIPTGVKAHSAVYATNPRNAGLIVREVIEGNVTRTVESEVMDIDENLFRGDIMKSCFCGSMQVPEAKEFLQKTELVDDKKRPGMRGAVEYVIDEMDENTLYIVGPGSMTGSIMSKLKLPNTLYGVDVVLGKQLIASAVTENILWSLIQSFKGHVKIIVGIDQGVIFGRGCQQISPRIIRFVGKENIVIVSDITTLTALMGKPLVVDTGDLELDEEFCGITQINIAYQTVLMCPISN